MLPAGKDKRGFTLVELVMVLLLIGVSLAIVLPNINRGMQDRAVRSAALGLAAVARDLRSRALFDGVAQQLIVNPAENSYLVARAREVHLPADVRFTAVAGGEPVNREAKRFFFFPNGSLVGGEIMLADTDSAVSYLIRMEPLTGRIEVARGNTS